MRQSLSLLVFCFLLHGLDAQKSNPVRAVDVDSGWAGNSINTVPFRKNSLVSYGDTQFVAFYNKDQFVILGKRNTSSSAWLFHQTKYKANAADAHNSISIMVDGAGYIHLSWGQHNSPLQYTKGLKPGSLLMGEMMSMTGSGESSVTYPEFYKFPNGDLLFLYRDGSSGNGNLVVNRYDTRKQQWLRLHDNLIDGEGKRNAYWQACIDQQSIIHLSWVWRETPDVASNHDICYARSADLGLTWEKTPGEKYVLPVTAATAEYAVRISQNNELINQASMTADIHGNPYIATYWRDSITNIPQYNIVYRRDEKWITEQLPLRKTSFTLSGGGTKRIPIARPQVIVGQKESNPSIAVIFRDEERGNKVSVAKKLNARSKWQVYDLSSYSVGSWEPTYDSELWKEEKQLHLFVQKVDQRDAEGLSAMVTGMIRVLEWKPF